MSQVKQNFINAALKLVEVGTPLLVAQGAELKAAHSPELEASFRVRLAEILGAMKEVSILIGEPFDVVAEERQFLDAAGLQ